MADPQPPEPDDKDWTWTLQRPCPECGFDAAGIEPVAIPALVRDAASRWPDVLARPDATIRPAPRAWSPLEYACHVRDVH
ncbi:MAG TPA: DinB family protein, partial [Lapillicoccus sp.]|nr:DinB family protein [Lapillicoccus sp.]